MVEILVNQVVEKAAAASAYKARDVVNAPAIKQRIKERSAERGDAADVAPGWATISTAMWWAICRPTSLPCCALPTPGSCRSWPAARSRRPGRWSGWRAAGRLRAARALVGAARQRRPAGAGDTAGGISLHPQGHLSRRQAAARELPTGAGALDAGASGFREKQNSGRVEHSQSAVHGLLRGQHGTFVEFDGTSAQMRQEMAYESQMMGHCVGQFANRKSFSGGYGEHYAEGLESGRMRLFSYRTGTAQPRITVNAYVQKDGKLQIEQIKGKQNRPPIARYMPDVVTLLNHLPLNDEVPEDALSMGIVRRPPELLKAHPGLAPWCSVQELQTDDEQLWLMQQHPALLPRLNLQSPLMQWMVAARKDSLDSEVIERMPKSAALKQTLVMARKRPGRPGVRT
jgi:hypothetical protein